jgi:hypothetical protein
MLPEGRKSMLQKLFDVKSEETRVFQVLLLHNDASQYVEVQEAAEIDFLSVQHHLERGGSVFITSKDSQKLKMPGEEEKVHRCANKMVTLTTFYVDHL